MTSKSYKSLIKRRAKEYAKNMHNSFVEEIIEIVLMNTLNDWDGEDKSINNYINKKAVDKCVHKFVTVHHVHGFTLVAMTKEQIDKFFKGVQTAWCCYQNYLNLCQQNM